MKRQHHKISHKHQHRFARLKNGLRQKRSTSVAALQLDARLAKCNGPAWGFRFTCRSPACPACRDRYIAKQKRSAALRFSSVANSDMAMITIILAAVSDVNELTDVMRKARTDLRNIVNRQRSASSKWDIVEAMLWLETDAFSPDEFAQLGPDKRRQVSELSGLFTMQDPVVWVPSLHGIMRIGNGLDAGALRMVMEHQWPGHQRVDVRPFSAKKSVTANLDDIINYSLKHECTTDFFDEDSGLVQQREWDSKWLCSYYEWLHLNSRGFQSTKIQVGRKMVKETKQKSGAEQVQNVAAHIDIEEENSEKTKEIAPMPVTYTFNGFDIDNIYWEPYEKFKF